MTDDVDPVTGTVDPNGSTNDATPTLRGTAEPDSIINIYNGGTTPIATVTADNEGFWTWTPDTNLADGSYSFTATATDVAGNVSAASSAYDIIIDTLQPNAPVIQSVTDDVDPVTGTVDPNGSTDDATPTLNGTAEPGSTVNIMVSYNTAEFTLLGTTTASGDGQWTFTPEALTDGSYAFTTTATDAAGNVSAASSAYDIIIDTLALAPTIQSVDDNAGSLQGTVAPNGSTDDATPTLRGTTEPDSIINIYNGGTTPIATVTADNEGFWTWTPDTNLADGSYSFTATATDVAGNVSAASSAYATSSSSLPTPPYQVGDPTDVDPVTGTVDPNGSTRTTRRRR